jgi:hypothetical protein
VRAKCNSVSRRAIVCLAVAAGLLLLPSPAFGAVRVWFLKDGRLTAVERGATGVRPALTALLAGPTRAERAAGLRSALPGRPAIRSLTVARRVVTVDLTSRAVTGRRPATLRDRVRQLVLTLSGVPGVRGVRLLVEGGTPLGLVPGFDLRRVQTPATLRPEPGRAVGALQQRLIDLGFLAPGGLTGIEDEHTTVAVTAFQKWTGLPRDGRLTPETVSALLAAHRPEPVTMGSGRRVEVVRSRQVALLEERGKVLRVVHVSTGAPGTSTPAGSFRVYRKELMSWSVPFGVWMPLASYFTGGIAFHQYGFVPVYPASHGCIRVNRFDARLLYDFAVPGTPVVVT